jgi:hypothetical protein
LWGGQPARSPTGAKSLQNIRLCLLAQPAQKSSIPKEINRSTYLRFKEGRMAGYTTKERGNYFKMRLSYEKA